METNVVQRDYLIIDQNLGELHQAYLDGIDLSTKTLVCNISDSNAESDDYFTERLKELSGNLLSSDANLLEDAFSKAKEVIVVLKGRSLFSISCFGILSLWYAWRNKSYSYTRMDLSNLGFVQSNKDSFRAEFGDVLRAVKYVVCSGDLDGLVCVTMKVKASKNAIGMAAGIISGNKNSGSSQEDWKDVDFEAEREILLNDIENCKLAVERQVQENDDLRNQMAVLTENHVKAMEKKDFEIEETKLQLTTEKTKLANALSEKQSIEVKLAEQMVKISQDIANGEDGSKGVSNYRTIQTQIVSAITVKHVLYFKELGNVRGMATILDVFCRKLKRANVKFRLVIADDSSFIQQKYGDIPAYDYRGYIDNKGLALSSPMIVLNTRIVSPIEDFLRADADILIVYDRLRAENDIITGGIVSRFILAASNADVMRARTFLGVEELSSIICPDTCTAAVAQTGCLPIVFADRLQAAKTKASNGIPQQLRDAVISILPISKNSENKMSLVGYFAKLCDVNIL